MSNKENLDCKVTNMLHRSLPRDEDENEQRGSRSHKLMNSII
jgi:hypothetical protein